MRNRSAKARGPSWPAETTQREVSAWKHCPTPAPASIRARWEPSSTRGLSVPVGERAHCLRVAGAEELSFSPPAHHPSFAPQE